MPARLRHGATLALVAALAAPSLAHADEAPKKEKTKSIELSGVTGLTFVSGAPASPSGAISDRTVGMNIALEALYRTRVPFSPFLDLHTATLSSGATRVEAGPWGPPFVASASLSTWGVFAGAAGDLGPLRARFGLGISGLVMHSKTPMSESEAASVAAGTLGSLALRFLTVGPLRFWIEGRFVHLPSSGMVYGSVGLQLAGDLFKF